jgi:hypothetical protein
MHLPPVLLSTRKDPRGPRLSPLSKYAAEILGTTPSLLAIIKVIVVIIIDELLVCGLESQEPLDSFDSKKKEVGSLCT